jgi:hypothetical protein
VLIGDAAYSVEKLEIAKTASFPLGEGGSAGSRGTSMLRLQKQARNSTSRETYSA